MKVKTYSLLPIAMIINIALSVFCAHAYNDIAESPYKGAIEKLSEENVLEGYTDGTFRPENKINRAEFTKIITETMPYLPPDDIENCLYTYTPTEWSTVYFSDVKKEDWYAKYVCTGKIRAVIGGYPDGKFKPGDNINYAEALKIIYESNQDSGVEHTMNNKWYSKYLEDANLNGIGLDLSPEDEITRGEMAQLIVNYTNAKPILEADIDIDQFITYTDESSGISLPLPKEFEDYVASVNTQEVYACPDAVMLQVDLLSPETYAAGGRSYSDLDTEEDGIEIFYHMPFNLYIYKNSDECGENYRSTAAFDQDFCAERPEICKSLADKRRIKTEEYSFEFVPIYDKYSTLTTEKNYSFFIPTDAELRYIRDNMQILD